MIELWNNFKLPNIYVVGTPEGRGYRKKYLKVTAKKVYKHDRNYRSTDSKSPVSPKHKKCEENQTKTHHN